MPHTSRVITSEKVHVDIDKWKKFKKMLHPNRRSTKYRVFGEPSFVEESQVDLKGNLQVTCIENLA
jgi:hypothetical protein